MTRTNASAAIVGRPRDSDSRHQRVTRCTRHRGAARDPVLQQLLLTLSALHDVASFLRGSGAPLSDAGPSHQSAPTARDFVLLPLLYFVSARIAVVLSVMPEGMTILWPPNGVLLAYFIRFGPRSYLPFGLLAILAELAVDVPKYRVTDALLFGLINVAEVTLPRCCCGARSSIRASVTFPISRSSSSPSR